MNQINKFFLPILAVIASMLTSCSLDSKLPSSVELHDYGFKFCFDGEKHNFSELTDTQNVEELYFGDSVRVKAFRDTISISLNELRIEPISQENTISNNFLEIPAGQYIPDTSFSVTVDSIIKSSQFKWAIIDTGKFEFKLENQFEELSFDLVEVAFLSSSNEEVHKDSIFDLDPKTEKSLLMNFNNKKISNGMKIKVTFNTKEVLAADNTEGVSKTDYFKLGCFVGESSFLKAKAKFDHQEILDDSLCVADIEDIIPDYLIAKKVLLVLKIENNTPFNLKLFPRVENLVDSNGNELLLDTINADPKSSDNEYKKDLDHSKINFSYVASGGNQQEKPAIRVVTKTKALCPDCSNDYVIFDHKDKAFFCLDIIDSEDEKEKLKIYEIKGEINNNEYSMKDETISVGGGINWEDYDDITINKMKTRFVIKFNRKDLFVKHLKISNLKVVGIDENGNEGQEALVTIPELSNFRDTVIEVTGLEEIINSKPTSIRYSADILSSYKGYIYDDDVMDIDVEIGIPLVATVNDIIRRDGEIRDIDVGISKKHLKKVKEMYVNAFVNNHIINNTGSLFVSISSNIEKDFSGKDSLVNPQRLISIKLSKNPTGSNGYLISDNDSSADKRGIKIDSILARKIITEEIYAQASVVVMPNNPGDSVVIKEGDYVETQVKFQGIVDLKSTEDDD